MVPLRISQVTVVSEFVILGTLCFSFVICNALEVHLYIEPGYAGFQCDDSHHTAFCQHFTLEQFSKNAGQYSGKNNNTSLTLELLPGTHELTSSSIFIHDVTYLKLFSRAKNIRIIEVCSPFKNDNFRLANITIIEFTNLTFHGCKQSSLNRMILNETGLSAALNIISSNLYINECKFHRLKGGIIIARQCNIKIYNSEFINSSSVLDAAECDILDTESYYYGNDGIKFSLILGRMIKHHDYVLSISWGHSNFSSCTIHRNINFLSVQEATYILHTCKVNENVAKFSYLHAAFEVYSTSITLENCLFCANVGYSSALSVQSSYVIIKNTTILKNEAYIGPVLYFKRSTLTTYDDIIIAGNIPWNYSASIHFDNEDRSKSINIHGRLIFRNNLGYFQISNSKVKFHDKIIFQNNSYFNSAYMEPSVHEGGAISCSGSKVWFMNSAVFLDNYSRKNGGALSAIGSKIDVYKNIILAKNRAQNHGGGIYLFVSHFNCGISYNFSDNIAKGGYGGGIYAVDSIVFLGDEGLYDKSTKISLIFRNNTAAIHGGGVYFETNSELRGPKDINQRYAIIFDNNDALMEGKAIYVDDNTYLATCNQHHAQCFLQTSHHMIPHGTNG